MTAERWRQIREVVELALELPETARTDFLDQRCEDNAFRTEVESFLQAHGGADTFLEQPAVNLDHQGLKGRSAEVLLRSVEDLDAGTSLGHYQIVEELEEGGMGAVYLAHRVSDEEDRVAIKVARLGLPKSARQRLRNEHRILKDLEHPFIARVLDAGTTVDGRPYFVMDYIRGIPIDEYCQRRELSVRERVELFLKVCSAVQIAHRQGVVHRDIKPSNILVTDKGWPKLLDFGIAKLLDPEAAAFTVDATRTGEHFLTPQYASPEQIRGERITPRTDVYSLGVLLYKLLSGRLPFVLERYTPRSMERAFENQSPPQPSFVIAGSQPTEQDDEPASHDLDAVVMKAIGLEWRQRYRSVESLVRDLGLCLHGKPPRVLRDTGSSQVREARSGALHQLPPPPADFVGREVELAELVEAVERRGVTMLVLQGMGGIGKTTLALKLAEVLTPRYPDAQIYLDLKGASAEPLTSEQAMAHVIHAFRPQAAIPTDESAIAAVYRSVLHSQHTLLLMDNAANREQVELLMPPHGCALLVTSRRSFALPGLVVQHLDCLSSSEAVELLRRIAPKTGDEAENIADLCGYLPIALRLAGGTLAERRDLSPKAYAHRLTEGRERLELIEASLSLSYELLNPRRQELWRALAVFPGTFEPSAAASIWDTNLDRANDHLGELVKSGLVEWADGRYRLHDLARLFAEHRLRQAERFELRKRHAENYLDVLRDAEQVYLQGDEKNQVGLDLFDTEWGNIQAGQAWCADHAKDDQAIARLCSDYPLVGSNCLWVRLPAPAQIRWRTGALEAAKFLNDRSGEGHHLARLGFAHINFGEPRRALELSEEALEIAQDIGNRREEEICLGYTGLAHSALGDMRKGMERFRQGLKIAREINDRWREGLNLTHLGGTLVYVGRPHRAITVLGEAIFIHREIGYQLGEGNSLGNLGLARIYLGQTHQGIENIEAALQIMRKLGNRSAEGNCLDNLASAYLSLNQPLHSLELAAEARSIAVEMGDRRGEVQALGTTGKAYLDLGETQRGVDLIEQYLETINEVEDKFAEAFYSWHLGLHFEEIGDLDRAFSLMQIRVDYERSIGHMEAESRAVRIEELRTRQPGSPRPERPIGRGPRSVGIREG